MNGWSRLTGALFDLVAGGLDANALVVLRLASRTLNGYVGRHVLCAPKLSVRARFADPSDSRDWEPLTFVARRAHSLVEFESDIDQRQMRDRRVERLFEQIVVHNRRTLQRLAVDGSVNVDSHRFLRHLVRCPQLRALTTQDKSIISTAIRHCTALETLDMDMLHDTFPSARRRCAT